MAGEDGELPAALRVPQPRRLQAHIVTLSLGD
jgi:hypothetical protein